ncbi:hypothetical protein [Nocardia mikamii]|uniref:hypothetical protein n=1 Tax=Nocardia mikamii TaxID=508464 RepID=UPI0007A4FDB0|nr:hypothetical protein [Nocardia mikamii]
MADLVAEWVRNAESPDGMPGMVILFREEDPHSIREQLASLQGYPAALPWDWLAAFDAEDAEQDR